MTTYPLTQQVLLKRTISSNKRTSHVQNLHFDSDSVPFLVDNGASASSTTQVVDFINCLTPVNSQVNGISGNMTGTLKGTVQWCIKDDQGIIHKFTLPNTYLVRGVATRVLSPQHLAQQAKDNFPVPGGTGEFTSNTTMTLMWQQ